MRLFRHYAYLLVPLLVMINGCHKEGTVKPLLSYRQLDQVIGAQQGLGSFYKAVQRCGLDRTLSDTGKLYTVFAPNDSAFLLAGLTTDSIGRMDISRLTLLLRYHIAAGNFPVGIIPTEYVAPIEMSDSVTAYVYGFSGYMINGAFLDSSDIQARNGVLHVVDRVLNSPDSTVLQTIQGDPDLSYLNAALRLLGWDSDFFARFTPITFFAPTNEAFIAKGFNDTTQFPYMAESLSQTVGYSLVNNQLMFANPGFAASTYTGARLLVTGQRGNYRAKLDGSGVSTGFIRQDRLCLDGVLHKIDTMLGN